MPEIGPIIDTAALADILGESDVRVLDCRFDLADPDAGRRAWLAGHIPGAVFMDLEKDLSGALGPGVGRHPLPDVDAVGEAFSRAGIDGDKRVVVYDHCHGGVAARTWWLLRWLGHRQVALLERGFEGWQSAGLATETGEVAVAPARFEPQVQRDLVVTTREIAEGLDRPTTLRLVDAREAARFRGEREPIDPVAGRVPGSSNLPFTDLLEPDGRFLPVPALREAFAATLGEESARAWIAMCGSGVTACHLAVAAAHCGWREPRIYVGSFSEWIRDPERPVATGPGEPDQGPPSAESAST